jgi:hypothetical protein
MVEYIPSHGGPAEHWGPYLPPSQPAGKYLLSKISKSRHGQHSVYSVVKPLVDVHVHAKQLHSVDSKHASVYQLCRVISIIFIL